MDKQQTPHPPREVQLKELWILAIDNCQVWLMTAIIAGVATAIYTTTIARPNYRASVSLVITGQLLPSTADDTRIFKTGGLYIGESGGAAATLGRNILETVSVRREVARRCGLKRLLGAASEQQAAERLGIRTNVGVQQPNIITLKVSLPGPRRVQLVQALHSTGDIKALVVQVVDGYIAILGKRLDELHFTTAKRRQIALSKQKKRVGEELGVAEEALQEWKAEHKIMQAEVAEKLATEELIGIEEARENARTEAMAANRRIDSLRSQLAEQPGMEVETVSEQANPLVVKMRGQLIELQRQIAVARHIEGKSRKHPEVRAAEEKLATVREALVEEQRRAMLPATKTERANPIARRLREEIEMAEANKVATEARVETLAGAMQQVEEGIVKLSEEALMYGRLLRAVKVREKLYDQVASEYERVAVKAEAREPAFQVLDEPVAPGQPEGPRPAVKIFIAAVIGALAGWVWVIVMGEIRRPEVGRGGEKK